MTIGHGIAVDSSGNAYVTGYTDSTNFPTVNPLQATFSGGGLTTRLWRRSHRRLVKSLSDQPHVRPAESLAPPARPRR